MHIPSVQELLRMMKALDRKVAESPTSIVICSECLKAGYAVSLKKEPTKGKTRFCSACQEWVEPFELKVPLKVARKLNLE